MFFHSSLWPDVNFQACLSSLILIPCLIWINDMYINRCLWNVLQNIRFIYCVKDDGRRVKSLSLIWYEREITKVPVQPLSHSELIVISTWTSLTLQHLSVLIMLHNTCQDSCFQTQCGSPNTDKWVKKYLPKSKTIYRCIFHSSFILYKPMQSDNIWSHFFVEDPRVN